MESQRQRNENLLDKLASLSDITLIAGLDQEKVPVVRKLLMQNSVYFEKLLGPGFREGSQQEVILQDIDGSTLTAIINFIYSGSVDLTEECVPNILDGASRMELVSLEKSCEDFLRKNLSEKNCIQTFVLADLHSFNALKVTALELVGACFERIPESDLLQLDGRAFGEILNYGNLHMVETSLFNLIVHWAEINKKICSRFMPSLLKSIRLEHLPGEFFVNVAIPIFKQYGAGLLTTAECERRVLNCQISPRRCQRKSIGKNVFYAEISMYERIDIYRCYPKSERFASIALNDLRMNQGLVFHDGRLYQMGGYHSADGGRTMTEVECIDMDTMRRTELPNMLNARSVFKPIVSGDYIYVFGGMNKQGPISDCERFDTKKNLWEALPRMPNAYRKFAAIEINGKFFVFCFPNVHHNHKYWFAYDPGTNKWSAPVIFGDLVTYTEIVVVKQDNHLLNVILDSRNIFSFNTENNSFQERNILLPGIHIVKIMECVGLPYIFYDTSGEHKFGRIVFNGSECNIVDSVENSQNFFNGSLFNGSLMLLLFGYSPSKVILSET